MEREYEDRTLLTWDGIAAELKRKKRKREEKADFIKHQKEYLQEFAHHQQQYESMERTTMGYINKQKQQQQTKKKQKRKQEQQQMQQKAQEKHIQKPSPVRNDAIPRHVELEEEKTSLPVGMALVTQNGSGDFENRKKQAQVALESLAMAAEAHLLL